MSCCVNANDVPTNVCLNVPKIFDQCRIQVCLTSDNLGPARIYIPGKDSCTCSNAKSGNILVPPSNAVSVTANDFCIKNISVINKVPSPFRKCYWDVTVKFSFLYNLKFYDAESNEISCVKATSTYTTTTTLFAGDDINTALYNELYGCINSNGPFVSVEGSAMVLAASLQYAEAGNSNCCCCCCCCQPCSCGSCGSCGSCNSCGSCGSCNSCGNECGSICGQECHLCGCGGNQSHPSNTCPNNYFCSNNNGCSNVAGVQSDSCSCGRGNVLGNVRSQDFSSPIGVNITIGLFAVIKLLRFSNICVQSQGICMPDVCTGSAGESEDVCDLFNSLQFPVDLFAPQSTYTPSSDTPGDTPTGNGFCCNEK